MCKIVTYDISRKVERVFAQVKFWVVYHFLFRPNTTSSERSCRIERNQELLQLELAACVRRRIYLRHLDALFLGKWPRSNRDLLKRMHNFAHSAFFFATLLELVEKSLQHMIIECPETRGSVAKKRKKNKSTRGTCAIRFSPHPTEVLGLRVLWTPSDGLHMFARVCSVRVQRRYSTFTFQRMNLSTV